MYLLLLFRYSSLGMGRGFILLCFLMQHTGQNCWTLESQFNTLCYGSAALAQLLWPQLVDD